MALVKLNRESGPPYFTDDETVSSLLKAVAWARPDHVYLRWAGGKLTCAGLEQESGRLAASIASLGVKPGERVAVMLGHHLDHVLVFFALIRIGAVLVPVNTALRGPSLSYQLGHSQPALVIADREFAEVLDEPVATARVARVLWRDGPGDFTGNDWVKLGPAGHHPRELAFRWDDLRIILYTSGTTGAPKGVQMSDRMLLASALGSIWISGVEPGDTFHFWDPIYHVFGAEVLVLALMVPVTLYMVPRFSASHFWQQVKEAGASHIHYVGGVLQMLLKQPESPLDKTHGARIAWGGGCPADIWMPFEDRFGITVREGYGMTETCSFSTINTEGRRGSIGKAVDYFEVQVVDDEGKPCPPEVAGEIRVAEREPGVLTVGYFGNPEATADALHDGWLYTGDLATMDADGFIRFHGRKKDSLRRRGENISAWEVERVLNDHPEVAECALIGVKSEIGDDDLKLFVRRNEGSRVTASELLEWSRERLPKFQVPRFWAFIDEFRKTPTQRIQKQFLSPSIEDCDLDAETTKAPGRKNK